MKNVFTIAFVSAIVWCWSVTQGVCEFIVYSAELPPYHFVGDDQHMHGASIEILAEMMRRSGITFDVESIKFVPWARGLRETEKKAGTMLIGVGRTEEREKLLKWIGPFCSFKMGLIAKKNKAIRITNPTQILKYSIGVVNKSASEVVLSSQFKVPKSNLVLLTDDEQQFRMLRAERVDLVCHSDVGAPYSMRHAGLPIHEYEMVHVLRNDSLYFAVNINTDDDDVQKMQKSLDEMMLKDSSGVSFVGSIIDKYAVINGIDKVVQ